MYQKLGYLAMITVPIAPVIFFGWRVYTAVLDMTNGIAWLAVPAAILTAVGLELVGILAGHSAMENWRNSNNIAWLSVIIMAVYVSIGTYELRGTIGMVVFWIAPLVYILVALEEMLTKQYKATTQEKQYELSQDAKDRELGRRLKLQQQQDKTAVQLAHINRTDSGTDLDISKTDWRTLTGSEKMELLNLTPEEIANSFGITKKTATRWAKRAGELSQKVSTNGYIK